MSARPETLPARAGVGLRAPHVAEILATRPAAAWLEVHAENYMGGGPAVAALERIRSAYPLTLHGVGLSLGSAAGLDRRHLGRLRAVVDRFQPTLVSEHLSWSTAAAAYLNHLLPMPYTEEALEVLARNIGEAQDVLGRRLLIENPSAYLRFADSTIREPELLGELARRTGCAVLCDVNNVYVSATNLGESPSAWLDAFPADAVEEMHLAGHARNDADGQVVLIDDHGSPVTDAVWALYAHALTRFGPVPTLIEWDTNMPALAELLAEAAKADRLLEARRARAA